MFALSEEHQAIREAVRAVCDAKVAPNAAAVDEAAEFPQAAYDALRDAWTLATPQAGDACPVSGGELFAPPVSDAWQHVSCAIPVHGSSCSLGAPATRS